jgi:hypothetical protein
LSDNFVLALFCANMLKDVEERRDQLQFAAADGYTTNRIFLPVAGSRGKPTVSVNDPHMSPL